MIYLTDNHNIVKLGFDFPESLPSFLDESDSKFERWVPIVMDIVTPISTMAITEKLAGEMSVYEVESVYYELSELLDSTDIQENKEFSHFNSAADFEFAFEYLYVDNIIEATIWFRYAESPQGLLKGYCIGYKFCVEVDELRNFIEGFRARFNELFPQCAF